MKSNLLPEGFRDSLPDLARKEFLVISMFVDLMNRNGYELVKPPLFEFEKSLFLLSKNKRNTNSFRVLDPISQKMMGLRSDITSQIARIASSSFEKKDRPLRLSYFGEILKVIARKKALKDNLVSALGIDLYIMYCCSSFSLKKNSFNQ